MEASKKYHPGLILALFSLFCAAFPSLIWAKPLIHGVEGSVLDGNSITITGTNFGNHGPDIVIFDDFEGGTDGAKIKTGPGSATLGQWDRLGNGTIRYTNSVSHSGLLAFQATSGKPDHPHGSICARKLFPPTKEFYGCWWVYLPAVDEWPGTGTAGVNWKQVWVFDHGSMPADGNDCVFVTRLGDKSGSTGYLTGNHIGGYGKWGLDMHKGEWKRMMVYWVGSGNGKGTCQVKHINYNGTNTVTTWIDETNIVNMSNDDGEHDYTVVDMGAYCHQTEGSDSHPTFDDFYFASGPNCRARVEIGDKDTYEACTNLTITTPTAWRDREITTTVRRGSLRPRKTYYLYVFDANGNCNAEGFPVYLVTSSGKLPPPPRGFKIVN